MKEVRTGRGGAVGCRDIGLIFQTSWRQPQMVVVEVYAGRGRLAGRRDGGPGLWAVVEVLELWRVGFLVVRFSPPPCRAAYPSSP